MKLDPSALRYLTDDDFRVLTAVELGMRNHELVPIPLISAISGLRHGGYMRSLKQIHKAKLVHKESTRYVGYRLTSLGYDYLALRALVKRGVLSAVGRPLGVGKEADVFIVAAAEELLDAHPDLCDDADGDAAQLAMKLHRLGRTSFRAVKSKRDYLGHRRAASSWIYLSRLAAAKEYAFMCALHRRAFPVPRPLGQSRHVVVMQLVPGALLAGVHALPDPRATARDLLAVARRLAHHGLVHCDLNEFNVMVDLDDGTATVIDFPQMVSTAHPDAAHLFERDVAAIRRFFHHRFAVPLEDMPHHVLHDIVAEQADCERLDQMVSASGFRNVDNADGAYGVQDVGEDADSHNANTRIDPTSLQVVDAPGPSASASSESSSAPAAPLRDADEDHAAAETVVDGVRLDQPTADHVEGDADDASDGQHDDDGEEDDKSTQDTRVGEGTPTENVEHADVTHLHKSKPGDTSGPQEPVQVPHSAAASIDRAAIEARVRAQRSNRSQRQMYSKRNIIKDSEKRKVKVEMKSDFWQ